ncbi:hypothetical protein ACNFIA_16720 [Pseudomonas sp. NY15437]|uniref:hypothetical protein n=1 Tax=Pseudomonas sp. NY15437 TaxID=3400360 RepID=UPI003A855AB2
MTTNNPNSLELNRTINRYSSHEDERIAYERMQMVGFKVAEILLNMPLGTMADLGQGEFLFVADYEGEVHVFSTHDWRDECALNDVNWFFQSDYQGLSADDLDEHRAEMERWLESPVFRQCKPADHAQRMVADAEAEWKRHQDVTAGIEQPTSPSQAPLNRYDHEKAKRLVDGYMVPSREAPLEGREQQFDRAKAELVSHLELQLKQVQGFSYQDYTKKVS